MTQFTDNFSGLINQIAVDQGFITEEQKEQVLETQTRLAVALNNGESRTKDKNGRNVWLDKDPLFETVKDNEKWDELKNKKAIAESEIETTRTLVKSGKGFADNPEIPASGEIAGALRLIGSDSKNALLAAQAAVRTEKVLEKGIKAIEQDKKVDPEIENISKARIFENDPDFLKQNQKTLNEALKFFIDAQQDPSILIEEGADKIKELSNSVSENYRRSANAFKNIGKDDLANQAVQQITASPTVNPQSEQWVYFDDKNNPFRKENSDKSVASQASYSSNSSDSEKYVGDKIGAFPQENQKANHRSEGNTSEQWVYFDDKNNPFIEKDVSKEVKDFEIKDVKQQLPENTSVEPSGKVAFKGTKATNPTEYSQSAFDSKIRSKDFEGKTKFKATFGNGQKATASLTEKNGETFLRTKIGKQAIITKADEFNIVPVKNNNKEIEYVIQDKQTEDSYQVRKDKIQNEKLGENKVNSNSPLKTRENWKKEKAQEISTREQNSDKSQNNQNLDQESKLPESTKSRTQKVLDRAKRGTNLKEVSGAPAWVPLGIAYQLGVSAVKGIGNATGLRERHNVDRDKVKYGEEKSYQEKLNEERKQKNNRKK
jgi:hypothetical protein